MIFSLDYGDADFEQVVERFATAAREMQDDGWWWVGTAQTNKSVKRSIVGEMLRHWR